MNFLSYILSGLLVLISISTNVSAAPRKPVYNNSNNSESLSASTESVESRLSRLERLLESQSLVDLLIRIDAIQAELQSMRGDVEVINNSLDDIKKRQRDLYIDVDRRLVALERGSKSTASVPASGTTSATPGSAVSSSAPVSSQDEQKLYQQAFNLLRELRYEKSISAFNNFISVYPKGRYAHIAQYWVGEANYAQREFNKAIQAYLSLITNYSKSPKVAEALLKIGYSYYELKDFNKARQNLNKLVKLYPETTEASQAKNKLQKIKLNRSSR